MNELFGWILFVSLTSVIALAIIEYTDMPEYKRKKFRIICFHDWKFNARFDDEVIYKCRKCGKFKRRIEPIEEKEEGVEDGKID